MATMILPIATNVSALATSIGPAVSCNVSPFNGFMSNRNAICRIPVIPTGVAVFKLQGCGRLTSGATPASGDAGWNDIAAFTSSVGLALVVNAAFATASTGGTLVPATYYYRVSAINASGEALASTETSQVVGAGTNTNTVTVNWTKAPGATGYKVYGRSTGAELLIATVGDVATYVDTGAITPAGALPTVNLSATPNAQEVVLQDWVRYNITTLGTGTLTMQLQGIQ